MSDIYSALEKVIDYEVNAGQRIAIYPSGHNGIIAKGLCMAKYEINPIMMDNKLCDKSIISLEDYLLIDSNDISIILCVEDTDINKLLYDGLRLCSIKAKVINLFDFSREDYFKSIKELCKVKKCVNKNLIRIGRKHDGGYIMLDDFNENQVAYSFGIFDDVSWDKSIANYVLQVYCYDHTIQELPEKHEKLVFQKKGIASSTDCSKNLYSMESLLLENKHLNNNNLILKMDVEGAEWDFLESASTEILQQFCQITLELHGMLDYCDMSRRIELLSKIVKTHQAIWVHANNAGRLETIGEYQIPSLLEITFVRKNCHEFEDIVFNSPMELDCKNLEKYSDIQLLNW